MPKVGIEVFCSRLGWSITTGKGQVCGDPCWEDRRPEFLALAVLWRVKMLKRADDTALG
jgi:hypothetical protein